MIGQIFALHTHVCDRGFIQKLVINQSCSPQKSCEVDFKVHHEVEHEEIAFRRQLSATFEMTRPVCSHVLINSSSQWERWKCQSDHC